MPQTAGRVSRHSYGSNVAVLVGNEGVLLVDAQGDADATAVIAAVRSISAKPIRYVINTHCHGDHTGGDLGLQRAGATIVAHENVRRRMEAGKCDRHTTLPTVVFSTEMSSHTDGDSLVYFRNAAVAATGDAFTSNGLPAYSKYAGGNMLGDNDELHKLIEILPADVKVIPGHGALASMADVRATSQALDGIRDAIAAQSAKGKSLTEIQAMKPLQPWANVLEEEDRPMFVRFYFECLTGAPDPKFQL